MNRVGRWTCRETSPAEATPRGIRGQDRILRQLLLETASIGLLHPIDG